MERKIIILLISFGIGALAVLVISLVVHNYNYSVKVQKIEFKNKTANFYLSDKKILLGFDFLQTLPSDAVIVSWWDHGAMIEAIGKRKAIIKGPYEKLVISKGIGTKGLKGYSFFKYESPEKIVDTANLFLSSDEQKAIMIMKKYNANYILVVYPEDFQHKFWSIPDALNEDPNLYVTDYMKTPPEEINFEQITTLGKQALIIKLLFDNKLPVEKFTKIFDNGKVKIYSIK